MNNLNEISKWQLKKMTKKYILQKNKAELLEEVKKYKKLSHDELSHDALERKSYFFHLSLDNARMCFKVAAKVVPTIRGNFPSKYRRREQTIICPSCSSGEPDGEGTSDKKQIQSQSHILEFCESVRDLREQCDPTNDTSLAEFFRKVVARNLEIEELLT